MLKSTDDAFNFLMKDVPFGASWAFQVYDDARTKILDPHDGGCMIYNHKKGTITVFGGKNPAVTEIMRAEDLYPTLNDPDQDFIERCLVAERNAISNLIHLENRFRQPAPLFQYMETEDVVAVVETRVVGHDGRMIVTWNAFDEDQMKKFQQALCIVQQTDATAIQTLSAQNTLAFLTGWAKGQYYIVYLNTPDIPNPGWINEEIERPDGVDLSDQLKEMYFSCGHDHTVMFNIDPYNLGGRLRRMHSVWCEHRDSHPKCIDRSAFGFY